VSPGKGREERGEVFHELTYAESETKFKDLIFKQTMGDANISPTSAFSRLFLSQHADCTLRRNHDRRALDRFSWDRRIRFDSMVVVEKFPLQSSAAGAFDRFRDPVHHILLLVRDFRL